MTKTKEPQNQSQVDTYLSKGGIQLGPWTSHIWRHDPRHLGFMLARYKFCAKMLIGKQRVCEVGCGDSMGTPIVLQSVDCVHCIDFEPIVIEDNKKRIDPEILERCTYEVADITKRPLQEKFDAIYNLDVIEHIQPNQESDFMSNIAGSLKEDAICIIGTPNITSAAYASAASQEGHVNLKSAETMRASLAPHFENIFIFSMNDEVVHTGYYPMAHYIFGMGVGKRR